MNFGFSSPLIGGNMSLRQLDFEDVKKFLIDPWHVLVVDSLCDTTLICTYGQHVYDIIEEVYVDNDATEQLSNLTDENVIFYDAFNVKEVKGIRLVLTFLNCGVKMHMGHNLTKPTRKPPH